MSRNINPLTDKKEPHTPNASPPSPKAPAPTTEHESPARSLQLAARGERRALTPADLLTLQQVVGNRAVQRLIAEDASGEEVRQAAQEGLRTPSGALPHSERIQKSFGRHDIGHVRAHTGQQAAESAEAMSADAYTVGEHVVFAGTPDIHTAAHEAAHVVQQRGGVRLAGGVGEEGDVYERHAEAVADRVARGESAEPLLDNAATGGGAKAVQRAINGNRQYPNGRLSIDMIPRPRMGLQDAFGEEGLIIFQPSPTGRKADPIELVQSIKVTQNNVDKVWAGREAIREAWKGGDGRFIDVSGAERKPRYGGGPEVSKAYNADMAAEAAKKGKETMPIPPRDDEPERVVNVQPGYHKEGGARKKAELWDHPSFTTPATFSFETEVVAREAEGERTWGTVLWGFSTVKTGTEDQPTWTAQKETATFPDAPSQSHVAAKTRFDEVMGNTGLLSPQNIGEAKQAFSEQSTRQDGEARIDAIKTRVDQYIATLTDETPLHGEEQGETWRARLEAVKTDLEDFKRRKLAAEAEVWDDEEERKGGPGPQGPVTNEGPPPPDSWEDYPDD